MLGRWTPHGIAWAALCVAWAWPVAAETGDSFSFVVIADPHLRYSHYAENRQRLERCVGWVNEHRQWADIRLVFVLGDIGWDSREGVPIVEAAKDVLDGLDVPYVPIIGDDDIRFGYRGLQFTRAFEPVYASLAALADDPASGFANWRKAPVRVVDPRDPGSYHYFCNFAFEYGGVQFLCLDWCSRDGSTTILGTRDDDGDLHDFEGGTWPWFTRTLADCPKDKQENIVIMAHNPMLTLGGGWLAGVAAKALAFDRAEFDRLSAFLGQADYADHIHAVYSGHLHFRAYLPQSADLNRIELPDWLVALIAEKVGMDCFVPLPGYDLYTVRATHFPDPPFGPRTHPDDEVQLELVTVTEWPDAFTYVSAPIPVPPSQWTIRPAALERP